MSEASRDSPASANHPADAGSRDPGGSRRVASTGHGMPAAGPPSTARRLIPIGAMALGIMAPVTLPVPVLRELVAERFGVSELATSLFMSVNMVGALMAAPLAGALTDRWGHHRRFLVGALLLDGLCFLALTASLPFPLFLALRFLEGCAHITALSVLLMLASSALPAESRGRAMGVAGGAMMLGVAIGAPIGGLLGSSGPLVPLRASAVLALVAAALAAVAVRSESGRSERPGLREIAAALRGHPALAAPLAFAFADRFTVGFFTTTFSLYLGRIHSLGSAEVGITIAIFMLPFALFSYPFGRIAEKHSLVALVCGGSLLYGVGVAAVGFTGPPEISLLMAVVGVTAAVMFVPSMVLTTQLAPDAIRATALGAFNAAGSLGFIVGPIAGGAISEWVAAGSGWQAGYRAAFLTAGASQFLCVALALPFLVKLRVAGRIR